MSWASSPASVVKIRWMTIDLSSLHCEIDTDTWSASMVGATLCNSAPFALTTNLRFGVAHKENPAGRAITELLSSFDQNEDQQTPMCLWTESLHKIYFYDAWRWISELDQPDSPLGLPPQPGLLQNGCYCRACRRAMVTALSHGLVLPALSMKSVLQNLGVSKQDAEERLLRDGWDKSRLEVHVLLDLLTDKNIQAFHMDSKGRMHLPFFAPK